MLYCIFKGNGMGHLFAWVANWITMSMIPEGRRGVFDYTKNVNCDARRNN